MKKPVIEPSDDFMGAADGHPTSSTGVDTLDQHILEESHQDRVPTHLFAATIAQQGVPATIAGQPIALKTAMK